MTGFFQICGECTVGKDLPNHTEVDALNIQKFSSNRSWIDLPIKQVDTKAVVCILKNVQKHCT